MNGAAAADVARPLQALLDLVEADRERQCAELLGQARARAAAVLGEAHREARGRIRLAFAEQRRRHAAQLAAAQARLATHRRLHEQQHKATLLVLAREQLPIELRALWQGDETRRAWVAGTLAAARRRLPPGAWQAVHADGWSGAECARQVEELASEGTRLGFTADPKMVAGLKVMADGNVIDGTLAGLLAGRADFDARLLRLLEATP